MEESLNTATASKASLENEHTSLIAKYINVSVVDFRQRKNCAPTRLQMKSLKRQLVA
jgi:hypothetical protein